MVNGNFLRRLPIEYTQKGMMSESKHVITKIQFNTKEGSNGRNEGPKNL